MFKRALAGSALMLALMTAAHADSYDKPGFVTKIEDGRLWVFKAGSPALDDMQKNGLPEKAAVRIGAGPNGMTIKAPDDETLQSYLSAGGDTRPESAP